MESVSRIRAFNIFAELQKARRGEETIFPPNIPHDLLAIVQNRMVAVRAIRPLQASNCYGLTGEQFEELVTTRNSLFAETHSIGDPALVKNYGLNRDEKYEAHLGIMTAIVQQLWSYDEFRGLFPSGTSVEFAMALCQVHDLSREILNNGSNLPFWLIDYSSEELVAQLFPGFPIEMLHSIDWHFGIREPSGADTVGILYKALDTLGKPRVTARTFFDDGGDYDKWVERVKNLFPMAVPLGNGQLRQVSLEDYCKRDKEFTLKGIKVLCRIIGSDPFDFLQQTINSFRA